jgi:hypothetical protein
MSVREPITIREHKDEIDRLRAEIDVWVEYVTCDRADLVLKLEDAAKENDALRADCDRWQEQVEALQRESWQAMLSERAPRK